MREASNLAALHRATSARVVRGLQYPLVTRNKVHNDPHSFVSLKPVTEMNGNAISIEHLIDPQPLFGVSGAFTYGLTGVESSSPRV